MSKSITSGRWKSRRTSYEAYYYLGNVWLARGNLDKARAVIRADRKLFQEAIADCSRAITLYDEQSAVLAKSIANAEKHGRMLRAAAERKKKAQLDESRARALELRTRIEKSL